MFENFKVYEVEDGLVVSSEVMNSNGVGHEALAWLLKDCAIDVLICGGMGMGARIALDNADIEVYAGVSGDADAAVAALLAGTLDFNPAPRCNHHDHHHGEGHSCGSHGCGSHSCH